MIRLKFVATIKIEGDVSETTPDLLPIDQIVENWNGLDAALTKMLEKEMDDGFLVTVEKQYSDVYQTEEHFLESTKKEE